MLKNIREVNVTNIVNGKKFSARFQTIENMNSWIAKQEEKASRGIGWGFGPRTIRKEDEHHVELVLGEYEKEIEAERERLIYEVDGNGDIIMEEYTYVDFDGEEQVGQRPIPTGEVETIPAVFETWVNLRKEYDIEILDIEAQVIAEEDAKGALKLLADTDWYIIRFQETAKPVPTEILEQRAAARLKI